MSGVMSGRCSLRGTTGLQDSWVNVSSVANVSSSSGVRLRASLKEEAHVENTTVLTDSSWVSLRNLDTSLFDRLRRSSDAAQLTTLFPRPNPLKSFRKKKRNPSQRDDSTLSSADSSLAETDNSKSETISPTTSFQQFSNSETSLSIIQKEEMPRNPFKKILHQTALGNKFNSSKFSEIPSRRSLKRKVSIDIAFGKATSKAEGKNVLKSGGELSISLMSSDSNDSSYLLTNKEHMSRIFKKDQCNCRCVEVSLALADGDPSGSNVDAKDAESTHYASQMDITEGCDSHKYDSSHGTITSNNTQIMEITCLTDRTNVHENIKFNKKNESHKKKISISGNSPARRSSRLLSRRLNHLEKRSTTENITTTADSAEMEEIGEVTYKTKDKEVRNEFPPNIVEGLAVLKDNDSPIASHEEEQDKQVEVKDVREPVKAVDPFSTKDIVSKQYCHGNEKVQVPRNKEVRNESSPNIVEGLAVLKDNDSSIASHKEEQDKQVEVKDGREPVKAVDPFSTKDTVSKQYCQDVEKVQVPRNKEVRNKFSTNKVEGLAVLEDNDSPIGRHEEEQDKQVEVKDGREPVKAVDPISTKDTVSKQYCQDVEKVQVPRNNINYGDPSDAERTSRYSAQTHRSSGIWGPLPGTENSAPEQDATSGLFPGGVEPNESDAERGTSSSSEYEDLSLHISDFEENNNGELVLLRSVECYLDASVEKLLTSSSGPISDRETYSPAPCGENQHLTAPCPVSVGEKQHSTAACPVSDGEEQHSIASLLISDDEKQHSTAPCPMSDAEKRQSTVSCTVSGEEKQQTIVPCSVSDGGKQQLAASSLVSEREEQQLTTSCQVFDGEKQHSTASCPISDREYQHSNAACPVSDEEKQQSTVPCSVSDGEEKQSTVPCPVSDEVKQQSTVSCPVSDEVKQQSTVPCPVSHEVKQQSTVSCPVSDEVKQQSTVSCPVSDEVKQQSTVSCPVSDEVKQQSTVSCPVSDGEKQQLGAHTLVSDGEKQQSKAPCPVSNEEKLKFTALCPMSDGEIHHSTANCPVSDGEETQSVSCLVSDGEDKQSTVPCSVSDGEEKQSTVPCPVSDEVKQQSTVSCPVSDGEKRQLDAHTLVSDGEKQQSKAPCPVSNGEKQKFTALCPMSDGEIQHSTANCPVSDGEETQSVSCLVPDGEDKQSTVPCSVSDGEEKQSTVPCPVSDGEIQHSEVKQQSTVSCPVSDEVKQQSTVSCPVSDGEKQQLGAHTLVSDGEKQQSKAPCPVSNEEKLKFTALCPMSDGEIQHSTANCPVSDGEETQSVSCLVSDGEDKQSTVPCSVSDGEEKQSTVPCPVSDEVKQQSTVSCPVSDGEKLQLDAHTLVSDGEKQQSKAPCPVSNGEKQKFTALCPMSDGEIQHSTANCPVSDGEETQSVSCLVSDGEEKQSTVPCSVSDGEEKQSTVPCPVSDEVKQQSTVSCPVSDGEIQHSTANCPVSDGEEAQSVSCLVSDGEDKQSTVPCSLSDGEEKQSTVPCPVSDEVKQQSTVSCPVSDGEKQQLDAHTLVSDGEKQQSKAPCPVSNGEKQKFTALCPMSNDEIRHSTANCPVSDGEKQESTVPCPVSGEVKQQSSVSCPVSDGEIQHSTATYPVSDGEKQHLPAACPVSDGENKQSTAPCWVFDGEKQQPTVPCPVSNEEKQHSTAACQVPDGEKQPLSAATASKISDKCRKLKLSKIPLRIDSVQVKSVSIEADSMPCSSSVAEKVGSLKDDPGESDICKQETFTREDHVLSICVEKIKCSSGDMASDDGHSPVEECNIDVPMNRTFTVLDSIEKLNNSNCRSGVENSKLAVCESGRQSTGPLNSTFTFHPCGDTSPTNPSVKRCVNTSESKTTLERCDSTDDEGCPEVEVSGRTDVRDGSIVSPGAQWHSDQFTDVIEPLSDGFIRTDHLRSPLFRVSHLEKELSDKLTSLPHVSILEADLADRDSQPTVEAASQNSPDKISPPDFSNVEHCNIHRSEVDPPESELDPVIALINREFSEITSKEILESNFETDKISGNSSFPSEVIVDASSKDGIHLKTSLKYNGTILRITRNSNGASSHSPEEVEKVISSVNSDRSKNLEAFDSSASVVLIEESPEEESHPRTRASWRKTKSEESSLRTTSAVTEHKKSGNSSTRVDSCSEKKPTSGKSECREMAGELKEGIVSVEEVLPEQHGPATTRNSTKPRISDPTKKGLTKKERRSVTFSSLAQVKTGSQCNEISLNDGEKKGKEEMSGNVLGQSEMGNLGISTGLSMIGREGGTSPPRKMRKVYHSTPLGERLAEDGREELEEGRSGSGEEEQGESGRGGEGHVFLQPAPPTRTTRWRSRDRASTSADPVSKKKRLSSVDKTINELSYEETLDMSEIPKDKTMIQRKKLIYHSTPMHPVATRSGHRQSKDGSESLTTKTVEGSELVKRNISVQVSKTIFGSSSEATSKSKYKDSNELSTSYSSLCRPSNAKRKACSPEEQLSARKRWVSFAPTPVTEPSSELATESFTTIGSFRSSRRATVNFAPVPIIFERSSTSNEQETDYLSRTSLSASQASFPDSSNLKNLRKSIRFMEDVSNSEDYESEQQGDGSEVMVVSSDIAYEDPPPHSFTDSVMSDDPRPGLSSTLASSECTLLQEARRCIAGVGEAGSCLPKVAPAPRRCKVRSAPMLDGVPYEGAALSQPAPWVSDRLYSFLIEKLEPMFGTLEARLKSETVVAYLCGAAASCSMFAESSQVKNVTLLLRSVLLRYHICTTYLHYCTFLRLYLPSHLCVKMIPLAGFFNSITSPIKKKSSESLLDDDEVLLNIDL